PTKGAIPVECTSIDEFLQASSAQSADVIKIDVEVAELFVLKGMKETIKRSDSLILFVEFNPGCLQLAGVEPGTLLQELESLGFEIQLIDENSRRLIQIKEDRLREKYSNPSWYANLYCVKRRRSC
ncbi:hypothetical protein HKBW3S06_01714, partial [Candidatus Hakubella thermalkaliphila]